MRKLEHCNIVKLKYFFYSSGEKVRNDLYLLNVEFVNSKVIIVKFNLKSLSDTIDDCNQNK